MLWPVSDRALAQADKSRLETGPSEFPERYLCGPGMLFFCPSSLPSANQSCGRWASLPRVGGHMGKAQRLSMGFHRRALCFAVPR